MKEFGLLLADTVWKAYMIGVMISALLLYGMVVWQCFQDEGFLGIVVCTIFSPIAFLFSFYKAVF